MKRALASIVAAGALLAACGSLPRHQLAGQVLTPTPTMSALSLPDQQGRPFALKAEPGALLLVYFGYTSCPDVCPTTLSDVRAARTRLGSRAARVQLAMATIDPARDTPARLAAYVDSFVPGATALVATDDAALRSVAGAFGAAYTVTVTSSGDEEVSHSAFLYALDDQGRLRVQWPFGIHSPTLASDLGALLDDIDHPKG